MLSLWLATEKCEQLLVRGDELDASSSVLVFGLENPQILCQLLGGQLLAGEMRLFKLAEQPPDLAELVTIEVVRGCKNETHRHRVLVCVAGAPERLSFLVVLSLNKKATTTEERERFLLSADFCM